MIEARDYMNNYPRLLCVPYNYLDRVSVAPRRLAHTDKPRTYSTVDDDLYLDVHVPATAAVAFPDDNFPSERRRLHQSGNVHRPPTPTCEDHTSTGSSIHDKQPQLSFYTAVLKSSRSGE